MEENPDGEFSQLRELLEADWKKNYGEFPIKIMGNFGSIRFYSNILSKWNKSAPKVLFGVNFLADFHTLGFIFQLDEI